MARIFQVVLGIGLVAAVIGGFIWYRSTQAENDDPSVEILDEVILSTTDLSVTVNATGTIEPLRSVDLNFEIAAPVEEILVEEGQSVRDGDVLANLEADDLRAALREAEIALELQEIAYALLVAPPTEVDLAVAEAAVQAARSQVYASARGPSENELEIARLQAEQARNQLWQSQLNRDLTYGGLQPEFWPGGRAGQIQTESQVAQAEVGVDVADAQYSSVLTEGPALGPLSSAQASLVRSQVALDRLVDGPDEVDQLRAEISLDQARVSMDQAQVALDRASLEAPFDGVVAQQNLRLGELPPQGLAGPAIQMLNTDAFIVDLAIDENDVVEVEVGQTVSLRLDALPEAEITGQITRLAIVPDLDGQTTIYRARVTLDPTLEPIRVGMSTTATIVTRELEGVLSLRNQFIRIEGNSQQAFVTIQNEDGDFEEVPVELGLRSETETQIVSGLDEGQRVVRLPRESGGLDDIPSS